MITFKQFLHEEKWTEDSIRAEIRNGNTCNMRAQELMRNSGDTRAIVKINGIKFAIDDSNRLKMAEIETDYSKRKTAEQFGLKTGKEEQEAFEKLPKLGKEDFKRY